MTFSMQAQYDGTFIKLEDFQQCNGIGTLCLKYSSRGAEGVKWNNTPKWQEHKQYNTRLSEFNDCKLAYMLWRYAGHPWFYGVSWVPVSV